MLNTDQVKLVQTAVRAAGIRAGKADGRYRMLLAKYRNGKGQPVQSCKELNNWQMDDLLAICESMGWRHPRKSENFYRCKIETAFDKYGDCPSYAMRELIDHLATDLCLGETGLKKMCLRMSRDRAEYVPAMTYREGWNLIEALKNMLNRRDERPGRTVKEIAKEYNTDSQKRSAGLNQSVFDR